MWLNLKGGRKPGPELTVTVEFTGPGGVRGAEEFVKLEKDRGGCEAGWSAGARMQARPLLKVWDWMLR